VVVINFFLQFFSKGASTAQKSLFHEKFVARPCAVKRAQGLAQGLSLLLRSARGGCKGGVVGARGWVVGALERCKGRAQVQA